MSAKCTNHTSSDAASLGLLIGAFAYCDSRAVKAPILGKSFKS